MNDDVKTATLKLLAYCQDSDWSGYEPYDALNSKVVSALPFLDSRLPRLALTQILKRSPINIRPILLIPKTQNPKAVGLFLSAFVKLSKIGIANDDALVETMIERLIALRSEGTSYWCWGYNFPWQTRSPLVPRWAPNLVCTYFAASALLDVYEQRQDLRCLDMAVSAAEYILKELYWDDGTNLGFSYPLPSVHGRIHNANFLAAALLCRVYKHTQEKRFLDPALKVTRFAAAHQHSDGSWYYGELPSQHWIDNFHTGFNLGALRTIGASAGTTEFDASLRRGFTFFRDHFFCEDGSVKYYHDRTYPIDTHCIAHAIITLLEFKGLDSGNVPLARAVFQWAMDHMWDERGFFYYRILRFCTIRTSYIRWTQAWMFLAMSMLLCEPETVGPQPDLLESRVSVEVSAC